MCITLDACTELMGLLVMFLVFVQITMGGCCPLWAAKDNPCC